MVKAFPHCLPTLLHSALHYSNFVTACAGGTHTPLSQEELRIVLCIKVKTRIPAVEEIDWLTRNVVCFFLDGDTLPAKFLEQNPANCLLALRNHRGIIGLSMSFARISCAR